MSNKEELESWEIVHQILERQSASSLETFLETLTPGETARMISRLDLHDQRAFFELLQPTDAAEVMEEVSQAQAAELVHDLSADRAAIIVEGMHSDAKADLLADLSSRDAEAILEELPFESATEIRQLMAFPSDSAGGIMTTDFVSFGDDLRVGDVLTELRERGESYSDFAIQYAYVVDRDKRLRGVLRLRELLFAGKGSPISELMIPSPFSVNVTDSLQELQQFFREHRFLGAPVLDEEGALVGIVRRSAVKEAVENRANKVFLKFSGIIGGEELRQMSLFSRSSRRLTWLSSNIVLNIIAASVIALYQDVLAQVIALAIFLPMISDMSGCSGNQAVAVSIREMALGLIKPRDFFQVFRKEASLGIINGLVLGLLLGVVAYVWQSNIYIGLIVGGALCLNTILAVSLGGLIPLFLQHFRADPALVSSPLLTTMTDMCGFFFTLSFAQLLLPLLIV